MAIGNVRGRDAEIKDVEEVAGSEDSLGPGP